jgi:hypothetical protein
VVRLDTDGWRPPPASHNVTAGMPDCVVSNRRAYNPLRRKKQAPSHTPSGEDDYPFFPDAASRCRN